MVRTLAVANEKGGVGKTTVAVNLAHGLALLMGQKVLLIDLDSQASATISLGYKPSSSSLDLLLKRGAPSENVISARENLDLIRSDHKLTRLLPYLGAMFNDEDEYEAINQLGEAIGRLAWEYDFVIVDCSPGIDLLTRNALAFCSEIVIPISLDFLSEIGTMPIVKTIRSMRSSTWDPQLRFIVPTFYQSDSPYSKEVLDRINKKYGELVTDPIRWDTSIAEAPEYKQTIFEYAPESSGSEDFESLTRKVFHG